MTNTYHIINVYYKYGESFIVSLEYDDAKQYLVKHIDELLTSLQDSLSDSPIDVPIDVPIGASIDSFAYIRNELHKVNILKNIKDNIIKSETEESFRSISFTKLYEISHKIYTEQQNGYRIETIIYGLLIE